MGLVGTAATLFYAFESNGPVLQPIFTQPSTVLASLGLVAFGLHLARTETAGHVTLVAGAGLGTATAHGLIVAAFYVQFSQPLGSVTHAGTIVTGIVSLGVWFGLVSAHFYLRQRRQTERLRDRTAELQDRNAELREQNDRLEAFASILSHDLRNPLAVANGYVELATETGNLDHLEDVTECHARIETLIEQVLALARMERDPDAVTTVDVAAVATDAHETVDLADGELLVETDCTVGVERSDLRQVFENCYRNSAEHAGPAPNIHVTCLDDAPGFAIEDDGPGIPEAERGRVLERGYSGTDGTGLGLNIVANVADTYGWDVAVTNGRDGGARFEFRTHDGESSDRSSTTTDEPTADDQHDEDPERDATLERDAEEEPQPSVTACR